MKDLSAKFNSQYFEDSWLYYFSFDKEKRMVTMSIRPSYKADYSSILIHKFEFYHCDKYKFYPKPLEKIREGFNPNLYDENNAVLIYLDRINHSFNSLEHSFDIYFNNNFGVRSFDCKSYDIQELKIKSE